MFFSVKKSVKIAGKVYVPCVCYPLLRFLELTVKDMEARGEAVIHSEMVFFQNGKIIEQKKMKPEAIAEVVKKTSKRQKKEVKEEAEDKEAVSDEDKDFEDF